MFFVVFFFSFGIFHCTHLFFFFVNWRAHANKNDSIHDYHNYINEHRLWMYFHRNCIANRIVQSNSGDIAKWNFFVQIIFFFSVPLQNQSSNCGHSINTDNVRRFDEIPEHCYFNQHLVFVILFISLSLSCSCVEFFFCSSSKNLIRFWWGLNLLPIRLPVTDVTGVSVKRNNTNYIVTTKTKKQHTTWHPKDNLNILTNNIVYFFSRGILKYALFIEFPDSLSEAVLVIESINLTMLNDNIYTIFDIDNNEKMSNIYTKITNAILLNDDTNNFFFLLPLSNRHLAFWFTIEIIVVNCARNVCASFGSGWFSFFFV